MDCFGGIDSSHKLIIPYLKPIFSCVMIILLNYINLHNTQWKLTIDCPLKINLVIFLGYNDNYPYFNLKAEVINLCQA
ncbi:MAG: hypothetical protein RLZZ532_4064 [Cyanobacteriota bacterium]|jgi:hypothetical protein